MQSCGCSKMANFQIGKEKNSNKDEINCFPLQVRIIAIKPRKEKASYLCHLRCEKKLKITRADYKTHSDHFRFHYGTADIMCPLPSGCPTPSHVAVTSAHVNPEGTDRRPDSLGRHQESPFS